MQRKKSLDSSLSFLPLSAVRLGPDDIVFRQATWPFLIVSALAFLGMIWAVISLPAEVGIFITGWVAFFVGIFAVLYGRMAQKTLLPSNWVLRLADDGLYIKYRSYLNPHLPPDDPTVVFIPIHAVSGVRRTEKTWTRPGDDGTVTEKRRSLQIILKNLADSEALREHLVAERKAQTPGRFGNKGKYGHYPVQVSTEGNLMIDWFSAQDIVTPRLSKAMEIIAGGLPVFAGSKVKQKPFKSMTRQEQEDALIDMAHHGDTVHAIGLAKELYGYTTLEAKNFIKALAG